MEMANEKPLPNVPSSSLSKLMGRSVGRPMDPRTTRLAESLFHREFRDVRVHQDRPANMAAAALKAEAFTYGRDIYLGPNAPPIHSRRGMALMGHEITHTLQQRGHSPRLHGFGLGEGPAEAQARAIEERILGRGLAKGTTNLSIESFAVSYSFPDPRIAFTVRPRLQRIAPLAKRFCEEFLGGIGTSAASEVMDSVSVNVTLHLAGRSDEAIARIWGAQLARGILGRLGQIPRSAGSRRIIQAKPEGFSSVMQQWKQREQAAKAATRAERAYKAERAERIRAAQARRQLGARRATWKKRGFLLRSMWEKQSHAPPPGPPSTTKLYQHLELEDVARYRKVKMEKGYRGEEESLASSSHWQQDLMKQAAQRGTAEKMKWYLAENRVTYLEGKLEKLREETEIFVDPGGLFYHRLAPDQRVDTGSAGAIWMQKGKSGGGKAIFVMSLDGRIFIGKGKVHKFHHSSFLGGGKVLTAGEMTIQSGKLTFISCISGHYKPSPETLVFALQRLEAMGVDLNGVQVQAFGIPTCSAAKYAKKVAKHYLGEGRKQAMDDPGLAASQLEMAIALYPRGEAELIGAIYYWLGYAYEQQYKKRSDYSARDEAKKYYELALKHDSDWWQAEEFLKKVKAEEEKERKEEEESSEQFVGAGYGGTISFGESTSGYPPGTVFVDESTQGYPPGTVFVDESTQGYPPGTVFVDESTQGYPPGTVFVDESTQGYPPGTVFVNESTQGYPPGTTIGPGLGKYTPEKPEEEEKAHLFFCGICEKGFDTEYDLEHHSPCNDPGFDPFSML
jgi:hypothetical protein